MNDKLCPKCGSKVPQEAPEGLCPQCLLAAVSMPTEAGAGAREAAPDAGVIAKAFPFLEILELIGQGGMGFVYKARQPKLDRFVALKILPQSLAADPAFAERFTREGRLLAKLNHPNIVTIHDFGQANGYFYLIMEYVDGVNLRQAMQGGRFTPGQALAVVPKICEALQFAHNEGVLHRDIKPENILLDSKGRIKIADFGIAKLVGEQREESPLTQTQSAMGTPSYMAPEQIEKPGAVDHRADIYSLGVVFYEMLTGELPLGKFAPPSEKCASDPRLDDVVLRALAKEPARRPQSAEEVKTQVEGITKIPPIAAKTKIYSQPAGSERFLIMPHILRGFLAALVVFLFCIGGAMLLERLIPKTYHATAPIINTNQLPEVVIKRLQSTEFYEKVIVDLRSSARSASVSEYNIEELKRKVNVTNPNTTPLYYISASSNDAIEAAEIVNSIARIYTQENPGTEIVAIAEPGTKPLRPNKMLIYGVGVFAGLLMGGLIGIFTTIQSRKQSRANAAVFRQQKGPLSWGKLAFIAVIVFFGGILGIGILAALLTFGYFAHRVEPSPEKTQLEKASEERWSPVLAAGEKPDVDKIREEANTLMKEGRYEEALQRHIWYHNHAHEFGVGQGGVRLSFALSDWAELARRYPKAKKALMEIRDAKTKALLSGNGYFDLFMDVNSINHYLGTPIETYNTFRMLGAKDPPLAKQSYPVIEPLLVEMGQFALCYTYIKDSKSWFKAIQNGWERDKALHPSMVSHYIERIRRLVTILVGIGAKSEAYDVQSQAVKMFDNDPRISSAISDAELKTGKKL